MHQGSWELVDGVQRVDSNVTGRGVGFDWAMDVAGLGVIDVAFGDRESACSFEAVRAANLVVEGEGARVVRLLCEVPPRSGSEAALMSANLGLLAEAVPVVVLVESLHQVLGQQPFRQAPWLVFNDDAAADAAIAELLRSAW
jgi:hypothetical protein